MSQHDYDIANGGGAAVRADINSALAAILSANSGATAPTATKPFMPWYDTTNGVLKMRNAADTAWISALEGVGGSTSVGYRNRLINGDFRIDQRNAGASVTPTSVGAYTYTLDRWAGVISAASKFSVQQNAGSVTTPTGFTNYLGATSLSAYSITSSDYFLLSQKIEGFNTADLGWGTANAKTVTLSFLVYSSLTGTFGGSLQNSAGNRAYPFTYTISSANTWTQINVTIVGDTTGTWVGSTNGIGIQVNLGLGVGATYSGTAGAWAAGTYFSATGATSVVGTNGATFYITGVQLEAGSVATPFERVDYSETLRRCQRYFQKSFPSATAPTNNTGLTNIQLTLKYGGASVEPQYSALYPVVMRAAPTATLYNPFTGTAGQWSDSSNVSANARAIGVTDTGLIIDNSDVALNWNSNAGINYTISAEL